MVQAGSRLGAYEITAKLGAGGMGEVYRATDTKLNRDVAIKVLPAEVAGDPDRLARFKREAQVLASLNHPSIAAIHGLEEADGKPFLVLELVEGEELAERLKRGAVPIDEAIAIAKQIAEALEEAHEHGIVHRDLKPANVKVTPGDKVKVLDFGLAKAYATESATGSYADVSNSPTLARTGTQAGVILGTAAYMSPEQARGKSVDKRADIWAFGVVLFEMLTGKRLFEGETVSDVLAAVLTREPNWAALPAATPGLAHQLLRRCLERDPKRRLHDIADARIVLEDVAAGVESKVDAAGLASVAATRSRRAPLAWLAALVVSATAAGLGGYVVSRQRVTAPAPMRFAIHLSATQQVGGQAPLLTFSPDGRSLIFSGRQDGKEILLRRELGEREASPIPGGEGGSNPAFSPDGRWLAFNSDGQMKKVAVAGGRPFPLANALGPGGCAWLDDDTIIYTPIYASGLYRVSADGGSAEQLTTPDRSSGELGHWWPEPLPGGRLVLFTAFKAPVDRSRIGVLDLKTRQVRWLIDGGFFARYAPSGHLLYARGQRLYAIAFDAASGTLEGSPVAVLDDVRVSHGGSASVAVSKSGTLAYITESLGNPLSQLVWLDRAGHETPAFSEQRRYMSVSLSPEEERAALTIQGESQDLWILSLKRGALSRLTSGDTTEYGPEWSRDGRELFYVLDRPPYELHRIAAGAPDSGRPLWNEPALLDTLGIAVSPDNRTIAFVRSEEQTGNNLYSRPIDGSTPPRPIRATRAVEQSVSFSPDGRFVAYQSSETGRPEVYVESFPGSEERVLVSADGGTAPLWAGNGEIFYRHDDEFRLVAQRRTGTLEFDPPRALFRVALAGASNSDLRRSYDVTRDGARILAITTPFANQPRQIEVVTDWTSELARLAPRGEQ